MTPTLRNGSQHSENGDDHSVAAQTIRIHLEVNRRLGFIASFYSAADAAGDDG
ncbi:MAG: hypothetical protein KGQ60_02440 [Planctomycetes bacterium]|nr:hypothetical protein [Planctomycetota bacterium]